MDVYRTISQINGDFSRKSQFFHTTVYLTLPLTGFLLELGTGTELQQTRVMGLPEGRKSFKLGLAV